MKALLAILAVCLLAGLTMAQPCGYIEVQANPNDNDATMMNVSLMGPLYQNFGWYAWAQSSNSWGQAYAGPTYAPVPWLQVGVAAGLETADEIRYGSFAWLGNQHGYALFLHEEGSAPWQRAIGTYFIYHADSAKVMDHIGAGVFHERYIGTGPYLELQVAKKLTLWTTRVFEEGEATQLVAARFNF